MVSCDLVTDAPLHLIADLHRIKDATMTALLYERKADPDAKKRPDGAFVLRLCLRLRGESRVFWPCA